MGKGRKKGNMGKVGKVRVRGWLERETQEREEESKGEGKTV